MNAPNEITTQTSAVATHDLGNTALTGSTPIPRGGWQDPIDANPEAEHQAQLASPVAQNPARANEQMAQAAPPEIPGWHE